MKAEPSSGVTHVFVVGMPRSGTTLLSEILARHSAIAIMPETHFFLRFVRHAGRPSERVLYRDLYDALVESGVKLDVDDAPWLPGVGQGGHEKLSATDVLDAVMMAYARRRGKRIAGEKTPDHLRFAGLILRSMPKAIMLCMIRDPRDVSLSWSNVPWDYAGSRTAHALKWRRFASNARFWADALPQRFTVIRYESLVRNSEEVARQVCGLIGVPFESAMLASGTKGATTFSPLREPWKDRSSKPIDRRRVGRWKQGLTAAEVACIEYSAREEMVHFGYELTLKRHTWETRLRVWSEAYMYVARAAARRLARMRQPPPQIG